MADDWLDSDEFLGKCQKWAIDLTQGYPDAPESGEELKAYIRAQIERPPLPPRYAEFLAFEQQLKSETEVRAKP